MKYGFSKIKLSDYLKKVGIAYIHLPNLGIPSTLRKELNSVSAYESLFDYYRLHILPEQKEAVERVKVIAMTQGRVVLTCFEADPERCHRHEVTGYLKKDVSFSLPVVHLDSSYTCHTSSVYTTRYDPKFAFPKHVYV